MSLLAASQIRELIINSNLISKPVYDSDIEWLQRIDFIEGSQIDLTVDRLFCRAPGIVKVPFIGRKGREGAKLQELSTVYNEERDEMVWELRPGFNNYYVGMTGELVNFPPNVAGVLSARSTCFLNGLYPGVTWIAPGFSGKLRFGLMAADEVIVGRGARVISLHVMHFDEGITVEDVDAYKGIWGGANPDKVNLEGIERPH
jgi:deoxycytidine triphosphate deaminase